MANMRLNMISVIKAVNYNEINQNRKELAEPGYLSAHWFSRNGYDAVALRKLAKKNKLDGVIHNVLGSCVTYYKKQDVDKVYKQWEGVINE